MYACMFINTQLPAVAFTIIVFYYQDSHGCMWGPGGVVFCLPKGGRKCIAQSIAKLAASYLLIIIIIVMAGVVYYLPKGTAKYVLGWGSLLPPKRDFICS